MARQEGDRAQERGDPGAGVGSCSPPRASTPRVSPRTGPRKHVRGERTIARQSGVDGAAGGPRTGASSARGAPAGRAVSASAAAARRRRRRRRRRRGALSSETASSSRAARRGHRASWRMRDAWPSKRACPPARTAAPRCDPMRRVLSALERGRGGPGGGARQRGAWPRTGLLALACATPGTAAATRWRRRGRHVRPGRGRGGGRRAAGAADTLQAAAAGGCSCGAPVAGAAGADKVTAPQLEAPCPIPARPFGV
jgi:hypothetical protein